MCGVAKSIRKQNRDAIEKLLSSTDTAVLANGNLAAKVGCSIALVYRVRKERELDPHSAAAAIKGVSRRIATKRKPKPCKVCGKYGVYAKGLCRSHYYYTSSDDWFAEEGMKICGHDGCTYRHYSKGYCVNHAYRLWRYGTVEKLRVRSRCAVDGCEKFVYSHGYCSKHWKRVRSNGDPLISQRNYERACGDEFVMLNNNSPYVAVYMPSHPLADRWGVVNKARMLVYDAGMVTSKRFGVKFRDGDKMNCVLSNLFISSLFRSKGKVVCKTCGNDIIRTMNERNGRTRFFCSKPCFHKFLETQECKLERCKLSRSEVLAIVRSRKNGQSFSTIAKSVGVSSSTVRNICIGSTYNHFLSPMESSCELQNHAGESRRAKQRTRTKRKKGRRDST